MRSYWLPGLARCGGKSRGTGWMMRAFCSQIARCPPLAVKVNSDMRTIAEHQAAVLSHAEVLPTETIAVDLDVRSPSLAADQGALHAIPPFDTSANREST